MTDPDLVAKKLARIVTCIGQIRTLGQPDRLATDVREERFVEHTLQLAIQAMLDVLAHIVSDESLGEPRTNRELVDLVERGGWLAPDLAGRIRNMIGFRNILVHGYETVDLAIVRDVIERRLGDFDEFVAVIRARLPP
jgi:uncharacterized protein YutE (UPF0331/DUF86 family)